MQESEKKTAENEIPRPGKHAAPKPDASDAPAP